MTGAWLKLEALHFIAPLADRSPYIGAGLSWSTAHLDNASTSWDGSGLQGELTAGYELERASTITEHRYAPSLSVSMGLGWQRGGGK